MFLYSKSPAAPGFRIRLDHEIKFGDEFEVIQIFKNTAEPSGNNAFITVQTRHHWRLDEGLRWAYPTASERKRWGVSGSTSWLPGATIYHRWNAVTRKYDRIVEQQRIPKTVIPDVLYLNIARDCLRGQVVYT